MKRTKLNWTGVKGHDQDQHVCRFINTRPSVNPYKHSEVLPVRHFLPSSRSSHCCTCCLCFCFCCHDDGSRLHNDMMCGLINTELLCSPGEPTGRIQSDQTSRSQSKCSYSCCVLWWFCVCLFCVTLCRFFKFFAGFVPLCGCSPMPPLWSCSGCISSEIPFDNLIKLSSSCSFNSVSTSNEYLIIEIGGKQLNTFTQILYFST